MQALGKEGGAVKKPWDERDVERMETAVALA